MLRTKTGSSGVSTATPWGAFDPLTNADRPATFTF